MTKGNFIVSEGKAETKNSNTYELAIARVFGQFDHWNSLLNLLASSVILTKIRRLPASSGKMTTQIPM